ncbi:MAG TPA: Mrp/NBP35 family ATP-binding protein [Terriglobia bacterium]|nr:Mrp/NBP35 family ATP-binding protein [Terriglobia bacterium]
MSNRVTPQQVLEALKGVEDAAQHRDIVSLGYVKNVEVASDRTVIVIEMKTAGSPKANSQLAAAIRKAVEAIGAPKVEVEIATPSAAPPKTQTNLIPRVKATIAVASGKGGVGKSTVAANLAVALNRLGAKVGLMDTDVYGPSVPSLMGGKQEPHVVEGKLEPPVEWGIKIISMGYFLPHDEAIIWRGPMLHKTIQQFLGDVNWGELDYLVMDLPPGTGDIQLSLSQTIPLTGAVIVSTPQDLALDVAWKAIAMFKKLNIPILGIVENMSYYVCPHCGVQEDIFGHGGAREAADRLGIPFLGEIPLDPKIRIQSDAGRPIALDLNSPLAEAYRSLAKELVAQVGRAGEEVPQIITE